MQDEANAINSRASRSPSDSPEPQDSVHWLRLLLKFLAANQLLTIIYTLLIGQILAVAIVFYFAFLFENPPVDYLDMPFQTVDTVYHPGDEVKIIVSLCRHTKAPFTRYIEFRNTEIYFLPPVERGGMTKGCLEDIIFSVGSIPMSMSPSKNVIVCGKSVYDFPFGQRVSEWCSQPFEVRANN